MKNLLALTFLILSSIGIAQKVNLSNKEELIKFLNKKEFNVGEYGKMVFIYDSYDKTFNSLKFFVEFTPPSADKKPRKLKLETMILESDGFYIADYYRGIDLRTPGAIVDNKYTFPTKFMLFENGELYYMDKSSLGMDDFIEALVNGKYYSPAKWLLCK